MKNYLQIIVGLGNPGSEYEQTRHNVGVWLIESLLTQHSKTLRFEKKIFGYITEIELNDHKVKLFKPNTYMNVSGKAINAVLNYYKIPSTGLLVAHDDLDLDPGTIRLKFDGGHGGHNGLRDIIQSIGTNTFYRARIGIGHPGNKNAVTSYVTKKPSKTDHSKITESIDNLCTYIPELTTGQFDEVMKEIHTRNKHGI